MNNLNTNSTVEMKVISFRENFFPPRVSGSALRVSGDNSLRAWITFREEGS